jgi:phage-related tail fiber protein
MNKETYMKLIFALLISLSVQAETNFIKKSEFPICANGATYFVNQESCGEDCLAIDTEIVCSDYDIVDDALILNEEKKAAREAAETLKAQQDAAMKAALKAMDCGKSAQAAMLVRNAAKNLTTEQVKQIVATYAPIKGLLDTGSLQSAIEEIDKIVSDGVMVTDEDKAAIIAHINQCRM